MALNPFRLLIALGGIAVVLALCARREDTPAPRIPSAARPTESQATCRARWEVAEQIGMVQGVGMDGGTPVVIVDEIAYPRTTYAAKVGLAETLSCIIADPGKALVSAEFRGHLSNKRLAAWSWGKLTVD